MELPVYYTFSDFEKNYKTDLEKFKETYKDASEIDYYEELLSLYNMFPIDIIFAELLFEEYPEEIEISLNKYTDIMNDKLNDYRNFLTNYKNEFDNLDKSFTREEIIDYWEKCNFWTKNNRYTIIDNRHKYLKEFYIPSPFDDKIILDKTKIKNFNYAVTKICNFINEIVAKLKPVKNKTEIENNFETETFSTKENTETPEIDYSNTPPLERMIILEKLGIIKYIQSIQKDSKNEKETARILSSFTGINTGTVAKNLGVMLGHKKNDSDKNSPYNNPKNQQLADNKLINFNIDLTKIIK